MTITPLTVGRATIHCGDARSVLQTLPSESVNCCVTSPPYWGLRDYGVEGQIGLEATPDEYVSSLVGVFREVRRVLRQDGTLWLNLGDCYATGAGKVGNCPGGGEQGAKWSGYRGTRPGSQKHSDGALGPITQPNRMPQDGLKPKDLVGIPWRVAFALQADGWWLRSDIIWTKPNPMPESVRDRPTKSHEYIFLLVKSERYYFNQDAVREPDKGADHPRKVLTKPEPSGGIMPAHSAIRCYEGRNGKGRNIRTVWDIPTRPFPGAHFATFPPELAERCIKAGCPVGGIVLDPFSGAGTVGLVCDRLQRRSSLIELNPDYVDIAKRRIADDCGPIFAKAAIA